MLVQNERRKLENKEEEDGSERKRKRKDRREYRCRMKGGRGGRNKG